MARCEDYPCCGHGPPPLGDGGGCPRDLGDGRQQWPCASCGVWMEVGRTTAICDGCTRRVRDCYANDCPGCPSCEGEEAYY